MAAGKKKAKASKPGKRALAPLAEEPLEAKKARAAKILALLKKLYPDATSALTWSNPLELLVATILSAQCTDVRVNIVTPVLFKKYRTAADYAKAPLEETEAIIQSTGFYHSKAKSIQGACRIIADKHGGQVPRTMDELLELPGVARKTANVVLGTAYGMNEGVVVDTHVGRLAWRLGLTWTSKDTKDPVAIERDLMQVVPRKDWTLFSHSLVLHGRYICVARKPRCSECKLAPHCPSAFTFDNGASDEGGQTDDD